MICNREHRYSDRLEDLPFSQAGEWRHKCTGCTYEMGYSHGYSGNDMQEINWDQIDESQAGTARHKDAHDAYIVGFADGRRDRRLGN